MRLIIADNSLLFGEGLGRLLCEQGFGVVAQTENANDLIRRISGLKPDVAIVDIRLPPTHTDEGCRPRVTSPTAKPNANARSSR